MNLPLTISMFLSWTVIRIFVDPGYRVKKLFKSQTTESPTQQFQDAAFDS